MPSRPILQSLIFAALLGVVTGHALAGQVQHNSTDASNADGTQPPIIDVHIHGNEVQGPGPLCPNTPRWAASDPIGPEQTFGGVRTDCSNFLTPAPIGQYMNQVVEYMKQLNVTGVVIGDAETVKKWQKALPGKVIPATSFTSFSGGYLPLEDLRADFTKGGFKVMAEIGLQYSGISPSDPEVEKYFALAEELDIPVGIHMGTGGAGRANIVAPKYRAAMGDPLLLEPVLARHPKLRIYIMHAGYPMLDNLLALLGANSHVYVDIAGLIWSYPLSEVNRYLGGIVKGGFEDRVMFGSDEVVWPGLLPYSVSIIETADYLSPEQKRDILYNNAVRFFRLH
jgi:predicted TIM-barrel fold metal-dependent hydrolase